MADLNKIQDDHRRNVLSYGIEDIHMFRKHSFVYLNMYMCYPLTNLSSNLNRDTRCPQSNVGNTPSSNYIIPFELATVTPSYPGHLENKTIYSHNGIL